MKKFIVILGLIFLITISTANAELTLESSNTEYKLRDKDVFVIDTLKVLESDDINEFVYALPEDSYSISVYFGTNRFVPDVMEGKIYSEFNSSVKDITVLYRTRSLVSKKGYFAVEHVMDFDVKDAVIRVTLPEESALDKAITDTKKGSISPDPDIAGNDGLHDFFVWNLGEKTKGETTHIIVIFENKKEVLETALRALIMIAVVLFLFYIVSDKYKHIKSAKKDLSKENKGEKQEHEEPKTESKESGDKEEELEKHLKEDEKEVIRVLKLKEGSCEQGTLRIATDFSKAKLSRLLMELEQRKIIKKESRGKKNIVFLK